MATDDVKEYLVGFYEAVKSGDSTQISTHYDNWNKVTEKYYKQSEWPSPDSISSWVKDGVFLSPTCFTRKTRTSCSCIVGCGTATTIRSWLRM